MGESFLDFMKGIGIFIICAQSLLHFTAGKSYEKYMKVLIGMMILAQFVTPVRAIFTDEGEGELWEEVERFQEQLEQTMQEAEEKASGMDFSAEDEMVGLVADEVEKETEKVTQEGAGEEVSEREGKQDGTMETKKESGQAEVIKIEKIEIEGR